jgi:predicted DNA-binding transcriptional regulator AlpA
MVDPAGTVALVPPFVGVPEIAQRLGVTVRTVHRWRRRVDFPAPLERLASGAVWDWPDVERWDREVRPTVKAGRPRHRPSPED